MKEYVIRIASTGSDAVLRVSANRPYTVVTTNLDAEFKTGCRYDPFVYQRACGDWDGGPPEKAVG